MSLNYTSHMCIYILFIIHNVYVYLCKVHLSSKLIYFILLKVIIKGCPLKIDMYVYVYCYVAILVKHMYIRVYVHITV